MSTKPSPKRTPAPADRQADPKTETPTGGSPEQETLDADEPDADEPDTDEPDADEPDADEELAARRPKPKSEPAKTAKQLLEEALKDPKFARELKARQAREVEAERKKWEKESAEKAKRATMDEAARLKEELAEERGKTAEAELRLKETALDRDIHRVLINGRVQLQENALDFLRSKVLAAIEADKTVTAEDACEEVLKTHAYLRMPVAAGGKKGKEAEEDAEEPAEPEATRAPGARRGVTRVATPEPKKVVDVMKMSPQEYAKYRKEKGLT